MAPKMKRCEEKDDLLIREMFNERPWMTRGGSTDRSMSWERIIATVLNLLDGFDVNQRSVRDRFTILLNKYKQKRSAERRASGIVPEHTALDDYLEESDREKEEDIKRKRDKGEEDKLKAVELRQQSMETFSETRKRNFEGNPVEISTKRSRKNDLINYLSGKNEREMELKRKKLELKEKELTIKKQETDNITQQIAQSNTMMMMLLQQFQQQNNNNTL